MFCFQGNVHHALTCFHVGVAFDKQKSDQAFNREDLLDVHKLRSDKWSKEYAKATTEYFYRGKDTDENENTDRVILTFSNGSFDNVSDIMSIEVNKDVEVDCKVAEIDVPDWSKIKEYLAKHIFRPGSINVQIDGYTSNMISGYIYDNNYNYPYQDKLLIKNAVALKGHSRKDFLKPGDSGALVYIVDEKMKGQPFAYCVCETEDDDIIFSEEEQSMHEDTDEGSLFICYRLKTAFEKLRIPPEKGCFRVCGCNEGGKFH